MARSKKSDGVDDAVDEATTEEAAPIAPVLQPGDVGYAPPARLAHPTGVVLTAENLGYAGGVDPSVNMHGHVTLAMPPPAATIIGSDTAGQRPSTMSAGAVATQFAKIISDVTAYVLDIPHPLFGKNAVVADFLRTQAAEDAARLTAATLGRTQSPSAADKAETTPPPEFFTLRHMAQQLTAMKWIYEAAIAAAGGTLNDNDAKAVGRIVAEFAPLSQGPTEPPEVVTDTFPSTPPVEPAPNGDAPPLAA